MKQEDLPRGSERPGEPTEIQPETCNEAGEPGGSTGIQAATKDLEDPGNGKPANRQ